MIPVRNLRRFIRKLLEQPFYALNVAYKRLMAYLYYDLSAGKAPFPESVTIFLTHKCNLRCKMCGQWGDKGITKLTGKSTLSEELTFDELKELVDGLSARKTSITLFGGEPFIHKDIIGLIKYIKAKGLHCLAITNGSLLNAYAEEVVKAGLDELNISLDGSLETHDEIRGMKGLFSRITEGLREVNVYKDKYGKQKPLINLQCTINKDNYLKIDEMFEVARSVRANSITFHHLIFLNEDIYAQQESCMNETLPGTSSENWKGFIFEHGLDVPKLVEKINAMKKVKTDCFVNFYPNFSDSEIMDYYRNPHYLPKSYKPRCISPWIVSYVFTDGEVRPCLNLGYSFGNIRQKSIQEIWNSPKAQIYRKALKQKQIFPACIRCTELFRY